MADNMKCSICNEDATVHLTQIVNNKIHKVDLCESCAQKKGVTDPEGFSLADLLSKSAIKPIGAGEIQSKCPSCAYTAADFRKSGRLGCAHCYEVFEKLLVPVLADMHVDTTHKGKVPQAALSRHNTKKVLSNLREALSKAVADEAYEDAAKYRDQIRDIEAEAAMEMSEA